MASSEEAIALLYKLRGNVLKALPQLLIAQKQLGGIEHCWFFQYSSLFHALHSARFHVYPMEVATQLYNGLVVSHDTTCKGGTSVDRMQDVLSRCGGNASDACNVFISIDQFADDQKDKEGESTKKQDDASKSAVQRNSLTYSILDVLHRKEFAGVKQ